MTTQLETVAYQLERTSVRLSTRLGDLETLLDELKDEIEISKTRNEHCYRVLQAALADKDATIAELVDRLAVAAIELSQGSK